MFLLCDSLPGIPACKTIPQACPSFSEGLLLLAPLFMPFPPAARLRATPEGVLACWTKKEKYIFLCADGNSTAYFTSPLSFFWNSEIWVSVSKREWPRRNITDVETSWGQERQTQEGERGEGRGGLRWEDVRKINIPGESSEDGGKGLLESVEEMDRRGLVFPSGCCQLYK